MHFRNASPEDLKAIETLLIDNGLPASDCVAHLSNFILAEEGKEILGTVGLEIYKPLGLLRSLVVAEQARGKGIGEKLYQLIVEQAQHEGINTLYLLTESAKEYFLCHQFSVIPRNQVPVAIKETQQFNGLCPDSAIVMYRTFTSN